LIQSEQYQEYLTLPKDQPQMTEEELYKLSTEIEPKGYIAPDSESSLANIWKIEEKALKASQDLLDVLWERN